MPFLIVEILLIRKTAQLTEVRYDTLFLLQQKSKNIQTKFENSARDWLQL